MSGAGQAGGRPARVAVVGAGVAGMACAHSLTEQGVEVRVFEQERCPGGRLASRRLDALRFDHGVQYFTAQDSPFAPVLRGWHAAGVVAPWSARTTVLAGRGRARETHSLGG